jgi:hypothetical protein
MHRDMSRLPALVDELLALEADAPHARWRTLEAQIRDAIESSEDALWLVGRAAALEDDRGLRLVVLDWLDAGPVPPTLLSALASTARSAHDRRDVAELARQAGGETGRDALVRVALDAPPLDAYGWRVRAACGPDALAVPGALAALFERARRGGQSGLLARRVDGLVRSGELDRDVVRQAAREIALAHGDLRAREAAHGAAPAGASSSVLAALAERCGIALSDPRSEAGRGVAERFERRATAVWPLTADEELAMARDLGDEDLAEASSLRLVWSLWERHAMPRCNSWDLFVRLGNRTWDPRGPARGGRTRLALALVTGYVLMDTCARAAGQRLEGEVREPFGDPRESDIGVAPAQERFYERARGVAARLEATEAWPWVAPVIDGWVAELRESVLSADRTGSSERDALRDAVAVGALLHVEQWRSSAAELAPLVEAARAADAGAERG